MRLLLTISPIKFKKVSANFAFAPQAKSLFNSWFAQLIASFVPKGFTISLLKQIKFI